MKPSGSMQQTNTLQLPVHLKMPTTWCNQRLVGQGLELFPCYICHHMNEAGKMECATKSFSLEEKHSRKPMFVLHHSKALLYFRYIDLIVIWPSQFYSHLITPC
ncbi:hypothetical protein SEVIR_5G006233v4 [Setaria viridis]|uniref:Uncharacterized protein n=2 Tax=Setaria viridis TaxID=4556 RepID=A0A4U6U9Z7_SETVI|nr:hypothetical protein SEVIR_5G006233v2 [Setaria viridis]